MANIPARHTNVGASAQGGPKLFRVGGSGFTAFKWAGQLIGFAQTVSHQSPQPVAAPVAIQPMDQQHPMQIITPAAVGPGTLQVQMYEMYNSKVWDKIMQITDTANLGGVATNKQAFYNDLSEVFIRLSNLGQGIVCHKVVYPPNRVQPVGGKNAFYADNYFNCKITDIRDDESIDIGSMEIIKNMTIQYTHTTRYTGSAGA
jgi:hypothetical protein